jgi:hypothetical protein
LNDEIDTNKMKLANLRYAKDYRIEKDLMMIWMLRKKLGA